MLHDLAGAVVPREVSLLVLAQHRGQVDLVHRCPVNVHRPTAEGVQQAGPRHENCVEADAYLHPGGVVHHSTLYNGTVDIVQEGEHGACDPERLLVRQLDLSIGGLHRDEIMVY